jgi:signal transduction histidine kinase
MSLRDTCEGLLGLIDPLARKRSIELKLEVGEDLPPVATDVTKFQQIVFNFLSNAVKFTEPLERTGRQPQIILRAERLLGSSPGIQDRVRVSVIDNGRGIAAEDQAKIFDKFVQLDGGHTREHSGTGLGLAICKELAGVLHAELQVVSELGRGSMFSVILPLSIEGAPARESELESKFRGALSRE